MKEDDIFKAKLKLLEQAEERLGRQLAKAEIALLRSVIDEIGELYRRFGVEAITPRQTSETISRVFNEWIDTTYRKITGQVAFDQLKISDLNKSYFEQIAFDKAVIERISRNVTRYSELVFGLKYAEESVSLITGGFMDTVLQGSSNQFKTEVLRQIGEAIATNEGFAATAIRFRDMIAGADSGFGLLERYYKTYVYDAYTKKDRIESNEWRKELGLRAFRYQGTVIKKTRSFCKERAGKVFTDEEAKQWKELQFSGKPSTGYDPIRDLGGWNCRHTEQWISNERAARIRPDLEVNEDGELVKKQ